MPEVAELTRVIALDGPAGSGKSTVARRTAQVLGWRFVDTGATYRAVTLHVLRSGVALGDSDGVAAAAARAQVVLDVDPLSSRVELDGADVSDEIRGPAVTSAVSAVSAVPAVRASLVRLQRQLMGTSGAVVEGRDIATVVAPFARLKVYLDAHEEVRARRRAGDAHDGVGGGAAPRDSSGPVLSGPVRGADEQRGAAVGAVLDDLRRRDALDGQTNRLQVSEGAVHLDTSDLTLDEVVAVVVDLARAAGLVPEGETT